MILFDEPMNWQCWRCKRVVSGTAEDVAEHLLRRHGYAAARWPDGGLVVDMSEVPELLEEER